MYYFSNVHKEEKETKGQDIFESHVGELVSTSNSGAEVTDISQAENAFNLNSQPEDEKRKKHSQSNVISVNKDMTKAEVVEVEEHSDVTLNSSQSKEEEEDEDSWDKMFDDDGECLDPAAMEEVMSINTMICQSFSLDIKVLIEAMKNKLTIFINMFIVLC